MTFISMSIAQQRNLIRGSGPRPCYQISVLQLKEVSALDSLTPLITETEIGDNPISNVYIMSLGITTKSFSLEIEKLVKIKKMSYMDAVIFYCNEKDIDPKRITRFIDKGMKEKLQLDAEALNYLPKTRSLFE